MSLSVTLKLKQKIAEVMPSLLDGVADPEDYEVWAQTFAKQVVSRLLHSYVLSFLTFLPVLLYQYGWGRH